MEIQTQQKSTKPSTTPTTKPASDEKAAGLLRTSTIKKDNRFLANLSQSKFSEEIKLHLTPDASGKVNEEQLQFAIVGSVLTAESKKLGDEFSRNFAKAAATGSSTEDNVKIALQDLVKSGSITAQEADSINGISFDAAQLDSNLTALFDGKGGKDDPTIAVASLDEALKKAGAMIESMRKGEAEVKDRALSTPSNTIGGEQGATSALGGADGSTAAQGAGSSSAVGASKSPGSSKGFLWKPVSDNNGKLVVLLPPSMSGMATSVEVHSSLPPTSETNLGAGKFSSNGNGGRDHFRFSKPGASFPDGAYVVARLRNGEYTTFQIGDSSARNTK